MVSEEWLKENFQKWADILSVFTFNQQVKIKNDDEEVYYCGEVRHLSWFDLLELREHELVQIAVDSDGSTMLIIVC